MSHHGVNFLNLSFNAATVTEKLGRNVLIADWLGLSLLYTDRVREACCPVSFD